MQQIANELAQLGISFDVIEAIMEPMTEEERVAFLATVEAMTTVQLIANFGN
jgi:SOS response regulatory protein OraA/RecX